MLRLFLLCSPCYFSIIFSVDLVFKEELNLLLRQGKWVKILLLPNNVGKKSVNNSGPTVGSRQAYWRNW